MLTSRSFPKEYQNLLNQIVDFGQFTNNAEKHAANERLLAFSLGRLDRFLSIQTYREILSCAAAKHSVSALRIVLNRISFLAQDEQCEIFWPIVLNNNVDAVKLILKLSLNFKFIGGFLPAEWRQKLQGTYFPKNCGRNLFHAAVMAYSPNNDTNVLNVLLAQKNIEVDFYLQQPAPFLDEKHNIIFMTSIEYAVKNCPIAVLKIVEANSNPQKILRLAFEYATQHCPSSILKMILLFDGRLRLHLIEYLKVAIEKLDKDSVENLKSVIALYKNTTPILVINELILFAAKKNLLAFSVLWEAGISDFSENQLFDVLWQVAVGNHYFAAKIILSVDVNPAASFLFPAWGQRLQAASIPENCGKNLFHAALMKYSPISGFNALNLLLQHPVMVNNDFKIMKKLYFQPAPFLDENKQVVFLTPLDYAVKYQSRAFLKMVEASEGNSELFRMVVSDCVKKGLITSAWAGENRSTEPCSDLENKFIEILTRGVKKNDVSKICPFLWARLEESKIWHQMHLQFREAILKFDPGLDHAHAIVFANFWEANTVYAFLNMDINRNSIDPFLFFANPSESLFYTAKKQFVGLHKQLIDFFEKCVNYEKDDQIKMTLIVKRLADEMDLPQAEEKQRLEGKLFDLLKMISAGNSENNKDIFVIYKSYYHILGKASVGLFEKMRLCEMPCKAEGIPNTSIEMEMTKIKFITRYCLERDVSELIDFIHASKDKIMENTLLQQKYCDFLFKQVDLNEPNIFNEHLNNAIASRELGLLQLETFERFINTLSVKGCIQDKSMDSQCKKMITQLQVGQRELRDCIAHSKTALWNDNTHKESRVKPLNDNQQKLLEGYRFRHDIYFKL